MLKKWNLNGLVRFTLCSAVVATLFVTSSATCSAQNDLSQPVHRVANTSTQATSPAAARQLPPGQAFDLSQRPGEHPLRPLLRVAKEGLANLDKNIKDYSCVVTKRERIDGELGEYQHMSIRVRHEPFSVYMFFLKPYKGREVMYNEGVNDGKLQALSEGFKRRIGIVNLDPNGRMAMAGQKYPITKMGLRKLTEELLVVGEKDAQFGECEIKVNHNIKINKRPVTKVVITHPHNRKNFRFHRAEIFIDNEYKIPVRYAAYLWPKVPGGKPLLEEEYTYTNIKINNGFDNSTFDTNNPNIFNK